MKLKPIENSYVNISGKLYDSDFLNLVMLKDDKVSLDQRSVFLTQKQKETLNSQTLKKFTNVVYIFKHRNYYGLICDFPIFQYQNGDLLSHELVLPEVIQGMLGNFNIYNGETAPTLLTHTHKVNLQKYIDEKSYIDTFVINDYELYMFVNEKALDITKEYECVDKMYIADGHHRLYATSLTSFKETMLSCVVNIEDMNILAIHRLIKGVDSYVFERAKDVINENLSLSDKQELKKGIVKITYNDEILYVNLVDIQNNLFWNQDVFRLNTQIFTAVFRLDSNQKIKYINDNELDKIKNKLESKDVLIELAPTSKEEFIEYVGKKYIMPPKTTCWDPKFPSFLIIKELKKEKICKD